MESEAVNYSQELLGLLLIQAPGFFFLKGLLGWRYHANNGYELFIYSLMVGILFHIFLQLKPEDYLGLKPLFDQPYAGAISLSMMALTFGWVTRATWKVESYLFNRLESAISRRRRHRASKGTALSRSGKTSKSLPRKHTDSDRAP